MVFCQTVKKGLPAATFERSKQSSHLYGFFTETWIFGVLKASDFEAVNVVSLVLGVLLEACCGFLEATYNSAILKVYVGFVNFIFRKHMTLRWTERDIYLLQSRIIF